MLRSMASEVHNNEDANRFEVLVDGTRAGLADYRRRGDVVAFTHTEVDDAYGGQGLASELIRGGLDWARAEGLAVLPFCPFVSGYIGKHPDEYLDLVPEDRRKDFDL